MATITKKVDKGVAPNSRYQYWASTENADDATAIAQGDIFMIADSLHRPAKYVYIETDESCDLSIRLNSQVTAYALRDPRLNPNATYDLENPITRTDDSMAAVPIGVNEVWEFQGVVAVSDIQIVTWTAGDFELFVA